MTAVFVLAIDPVGGDFVAFLPKHDRDGPVLNSCIYRPSEELLDILRHGIGGDIPVPGLPSKKRISNTPSHNIGLKAGLMDGVQDYFRIIRHINLHTLIIA